MENTMQTLLGNTMQYHKYNNEYNNIYSYIKHPGGIGTMTVSEIGTQSITTGKPLMSHKGPVPIF